MAQSDTHDPRAQNYDPMTHMTQGDFGAKKAQFLIRKFKFRVFFETCTFNFIKVHEPS